MLYVDNDGHTDPSINLAIEEYLLRHDAISEPILLLYINEPSVIVGRNQNIFQETDPEFLQSRNIHLVRRLSGGGAVYHDLGNLNYSFITPGKKELHKFQEVTEPIVRALIELGLKAEFRGKSDIVANGKKISGNAQYVSAGRMFSHGTLLFDSDLKTLSRALQPRHNKIDSKAVQSVRSQVTNIRQLLPKDMTIDELKEAIISNIFGGVDIPVYELTALAWEQIQDLVNERYRQWTWTFGRSPKFRVENSQLLAGSQINIRLEVVKGRIQSIDFDSDGAHFPDASQLEQGLIGSRYDQASLTEVLQQLDLGQNWAAIRKEQLIKLIY